eukprot:scaffold7804_cov390-Prasinococcus_capsulatus_cf.AAC.3
MNPSSLGILYSHALVHLSRRCASLLSAWTDCVQSHAWWTHPCIEVVLRVAADADGRDVV